MQQSARRPRAALLFVPFAPLAGRPGHRPSKDRFRYSPRRPCTTLCLSQQNSRREGDISLLSSTSASRAVPTAQDGEPSTTVDIHTESLSLLEWPQISAHVLNHASTPQGRAVLCPSGAGVYIGSTRAESERLLKETRELYNLEFVRCKPLSFAGVHDVSALVKLAAIGKVLPGKDLLCIARTLYAARAIRKQIDAEVSAGAELPVCEELVSTFRTWPEKEREIVACLDDFGDVADSADPELRGIRQALKDCLSDVREKLNAIMARHADAVQDRIITQRYDRFVIPVKMSRKSEFRRGIVHDASSTGSTAYIEPAAVKPINDRLRELVAKEKARVQAILRRLTEEVVAPVADDICNLGATLALIDAAVARARCSKALDAVDVKFDDSKPLKLVGGRHPLLSWKAMAETSSDHGAEEKEVEQGKPVLNSGIQIGRGAAEKQPAWKKKVVPSSYILDEDIRCVCVTGPNTGGKTLSLKTLGTCVLMAKAGLFVPAKAPASIAFAAKAHGVEQLTSPVQVPDDTETVRMPYFDSVLVDIGDDQSLVQSLSTFSGHIQRIKRILAASTAKSLVLLDEIGSGTDPAEGAALGTAILRHLAIGRRAALTFATTHHGELKTLKYDEDSSARFFENASVEFDDVRMAPTFKLIWGIPGRSNALAIANRLGLDKRVVDAAHDLLTGASGEGPGSSSRVDLEKMISSLEKEKTAAEVAREEAESSLEKIEGMRAELQGRLGRLQANEKALRKDQKVAMDMEVEAARKKIAKVIKEMQQGGGSAQAAGRATEKLGRISEHGVPGSSTASASAESEGFEAVEVDEISVGDRVTVPRLGSGSMEVVTVVSKKELMVAIGAMKAKVKVKEVSSVSRPRRRVTSQTYRTPSSEKTNAQKKKMLVRTAANTIDIRGERVDSAEGKVDQAIDKALSMGTLWIIHGHGTGRLKNGIREFLKGHHLVEKMEDAEQSDGGTGVTIAHLA